MALVFVAWLVACGGANAALPLPEGRHYELVSAPDKNSNVVLGGSVAPTGDRVQAVTTSELSGGGLTSWPLSVRGGLLGWKAHSVLPPSEDRIGPSYKIFAQTDGLSQFLAGVTQGLFFSAPTTLVHLDGNGQQSILQAFARNQQNGLAIDLISDDGKRAFANLTTPFDPAHMPDTRNVYDVQQVPPVLVDRMPDNAVPACGGGFPIDVNATKGQHQISSDGSHVFFLSNGDCSTPSELYVRDLDAGATMLVSGPAAPGTDGDATFLQATADGSQVAYLSSAQLSAADTNPNPDVYVWKAGVGPGSGNTCVTCVVADANVFGSDAVAVSQDLSHVYFESLNQLVAGEGAPGASNLYVWHRTPGSGLAGVIDYISPASAITASPYRDEGGEVTPDGNVLLFTSNDPGLDGVTSPVSQNGGFFEYYRYDDNNGTGSTVTCVSCPLERSATVDVPRSLLSGNGLTPLSYYNRALSDDGSRVFFRTSEPLVSRDVNQSQDVYEWHDGQAGLLTDGVTPHGPGTANELLGSSASGNDVFISSWDALTPDVVDRSNQVYDVRTGPIPPFARAAVACEGDGCQGLPSGAPAVARALSSTVIGPSTGGTLVPAFVVGRPTGGSEGELVRTGRLLVPVRVNMAGRVSVAARAVLGRHTHTVATGSRVLRKAGVVSVGLRLSHAARAALAKGGRLRVRFVVRFSKVRTSKSVVVVLRVPVVRHGR